jgi:hypothetical protein
MLEQLKLLRSQCCRYNGHDVNMHMLGKGILFEQSSTAKFNITEQANQYEGDFYA